MRLLPGMLLAIVIALPAVAQSSYVNAEDPLPMRADKTYLDLLRLAIPDIEPVDGAYTGTLGQSLPDLSGPGEPPLENIAVSTATLEVITLIADSTLHMALLVEADIDGAPGAALIIVDLTDEPQLVATANVATDQSTSVDSRMSIGPSDEALIVSNSHFNSSEGYMTQSLIGLVDERLVELASVFTLREFYCGVDRQQLASFAPLIDADGGQYQRFIVTVTEVTLPTAEDCGDAAPSPGTTAAAATYTWNGEAYSPDSDALDRLYRETKNRF